MSAKEEGRTLTGVTPLEPEGTGRGAKDNESRDVGENLSPQDAAGNLTDPQNSGSRSGIATTEKRCLGCGETKPLYAFYANKGGLHGRQSRCKPCFFQQIKATPGRSIKQRARNAVRNALRSARLIKPPTCSADLGYQRSDIAVLRDELVPKDDEIRRLKADLLDATREVEQFRRKVRR